MRRARHDHGQTNRQRRCRGNAQTSSSTPHPAPSCQLHRQATKCGALRARGYADSAASARGGDCNGHSSTDNSGATAGGPGQGGNGGQGAAAGGAGGGGGGGFFGGGGGGGDPSQVGGGGGGGGGSSQGPTGTTYTTAPSTDKPHVVISWMIAPPVSTTVNDAGSGQPWSGNETTGAKSYDTASLGGTVSGFTPSGTVTYSFFTSGDCSGTAASTQTVTLNPDGTVPNSSTTSALAAGSYSYQASYSGDLNYSPSNGPCEPFSVLATLAVSRSGTGSGTVSSSDGKIDCGSQCSQACATGATVTLTATPASGSTFTGWSGGGCSGTGTCTVTMSSDQSVTAIFTAFGIGGGGGGGVFLLAPTVDSSQASGITSTGATFSAQINPNGLPTTAHFEYGPTTAYGSSTPEQGVGSGSGTHTSSAASGGDAAVSVTISGLSPATTYHFRVVATNAAGSTDGVDEAFTTQPASNNGGGGNGGSGGAGGSAHTPTRPQLILKPPTARRARKGCRSEINRAGTAAISNRHCRSAVITFTGTIDPRAVGQIILITLKATINGHQITITARARIANGHYTITVKLPARQTDANHNPHKNTGGDPWQYTVSYPGNPDLQPATITGGFQLEIEPGKPRHHHPTRHP